MNTRVSKKMATSFDSVGASCAILSVNALNQQSQVVNTFLEATQPNDLPHLVIGSKVDWVGQDDLYAFEHDLGCRVVPMSLLTTQDTDHLRESLSIGQFFETGVTCLPVSHRLSQASPVSFAKGAKTRKSKTRKQGNAVRRQPRRDHQEQRQIGRSIQLCMGRLGLYAGGLARLDGQGIGPIHDTGISCRQEVGH